jgi:uridine kinase
LLHDVQRAIRSAQDASHLSNEQQIVIVEGFLVYHDARLVSLATHRIFLSIDEETCFQRRL